MIDKHYLFMLTACILLAIVFYIAKRRSIEAFTDKENLDGKSILVTAATSGLGLELVKVLAKRNVSLFITGRQPDTVIELVEELNKVNKRIWGQHADFTDDKQTTAMWREAVNKLKRVDVVIHLPIRSYTRMKISKTDKGSFVDLNKKNLDRIMLINQMAIDHMKGKKILGKIIVSSSAKAEANSTKLTHGSLILMNSQIERYTDILSKELEGYNIGVCCVRIDKDTSNSLINYKFPIKPNKLAEKLLKPLDKIPKLFGRDPKKIVGVYMECLRLENTEINGKVFSTETFINNRKVANYVSPDTLQRNTDHKYYLVDNDKLDTDNENQVYLNRQINYKLPLKVKKLLESNNVQDLVSGVNKRHKYKGEIPSILAEKCGVPANTVEVFNTEYDAIRKLFEVFVSSRDTICSEEPTCPQLTSVIKDNGNDRSFVDFKINKSERTIDIDIKRLDKNLTGSVKILWISSPGLITGVSIERERFEEIMLKVPSRTIVVLDQRLLECSFNERAFDASKLISKHRNLIVFRSLNNFYSVENLKLAYTICNSELNEIITEKNIVSDIDSFSERLALEAIKDKKYEETTRNIIKREREFMETRLNESNVKFIKGDTHIILVNTYRGKKDIVEDLENEDILLYKSNDEISNYWTLPISMKNEINDKIISIINYSV